MFTRTGLTALGDGPSRHRPFGPVRGVPGRTRSGPATRCNAIRLAGRKTYLFAFVDDHSRAVMAARFGFAEDAVPAGRRASPRRWPPRGGSPSTSYVDNGSAFVDRVGCCGACAPPRRQAGPTPSRERPQGRGKIERFLCATRRRWSYPRLSREELGGRFLGLMAYLMPKRLRGQEHAS